MMEAIWTWLNSPQGLMVLAAILTWLLQRLYARRPDWRKWEGTIIAAVKYAEKAIEPGSPGSAAAKLDAALQYVLRVYEATQGHAPSSAEYAQLREGVQIVHERLEANNTL